MCTVKMFFFLDTFEKADLDTFEKADEKLEQARHIGSAN